MIRRVFAFLAAVALIGVCGVSEADAARYHNRTRMSLRRTAVNQAAYPRYRQIDGKTLWDLGKQNGRWPKL